jgi:hypothetical protein
MRTPGRRAATVAALLLVPACTQFLGPTRTAEDYELKAASTADSVLSAVQTARLVVTAADHDKAFGTYVSVALADAEDDAGGAAATFARLQPPDRASDALRDELTDLTDEASATLADLRITARRGDLDALARRAEPLAGIARDLSAFSERHG